MNAKMLEPLLRDATIKAIDGISQRVAKVEVEAETFVTRLLRRWNDMDSAEKENVVGVVIATASTVVTAIAAAKAASKPRKMLKKAAKKAARKVSKKVL